MNPEQSFFFHESRTKHICLENFLVWLLPYKAIWKASWMDEILLCWILLTSWTFNMCSCEFKSSHVTIAIFNTGTYVQLLMATTTESVTIAIYCTYRLHVYQKKWSPITGDNLNVDYMEPNVWLNLRASMPR